MTAHAVLADFVVLLHIAFVLFVVLGGLLALRWQWAPYVHLPAVTWGFWIEVTGGVCPLTPLENSLRQSAGEAGYDGGFIQHYLLPVLYPSWLDLPAQYVLAGLVLVLNAVIYTILWRRRRAR